MARRSCGSNLLEFTFTKRAMEERGQIDVIFTDFQKAFDCVDHALLMRKMAKVGFPPNILAFFRSNLSGRELRVRVGLVTSDTFIATSGVAQGSHIRPMLFLLFINDIEAAILLFSDDLKMFVLIRLDRRRPPHPK